MIFKNFGPLLKMTESYILYSISYLRFETFLSFKVSKGICKIIDENWVLEPQDYKNDTQP